VRQRRSPRDPFPDADGATANIGSQTVSWGWDSTARHAAPLERRLHRQRRSSRSQHAHIVGGPRSMPWLAGQSAKMLRADHDADWVRRPPPALRRQHAVDPDVSMPKACEPINASPETFRSTRRYFGAEDMVSPLSGLRACPLRPRSRRSSYRCLRQPGSARTGISTVHRNPGGILHHLCRPVWPSDDEGLFQRRCLVVFRCGFEHLSMMFASALAFWFR